nr:hypothetical protein [Tanacetum cinerariifolium]
MQTQENKIDMGKALDADLVVTKSSEAESKVQDESSGSGNDTNTDDADIKPIYDEEPMAEVQLTAEYNIFATGQQHNEQPEIINEAQIQEKFFAIAVLKNELRKLKGNSVDTKFTKSSVLGKPVLQPLRNQSVVRQQNGFKSERSKISKLRWIPTGKLLDSCMGKVDSEPRHGSNVDISKIHECKQTLDLSSLGMIKMNEEKGIMPTKIKLTLEQAQQGVSNDVLVSIEGVEELKSNVWIKGDLAMVVSLEHLMLPIRLTLFDAAEPFVAVVYGVWHWWLAEIISDLAWQIVTFAAMADASYLSIASLPEISECANGGKDYHKRADRSCPYVSLDDVVVHSRWSLCYQERAW